MENEAASNAVVGVKDRDLPWSIVSTQFDSGKVQPPRSLAIRTFSQHSDFFQRGAIKKKFLPRSTRVITLRRSQTNFAAVPFVSGTNGTATYSDLQPTAYFDPNVGAVITTGRQTGSWSLFYSADQALHVDPSNPKRSYGLFTNLGLADNGPSPIRWSANVGLGGSSPVKSRPLNTFGIGYSHVGSSGPVKNLAPVLLPIGNDDAVELFYNIAVTPYFRITPDLQILMPAQQRTLLPDARDIDTAVAFGLRGKIDF